MGKPVVYFEIAGRDGEALKEFFGSLFDWKIGRHAPAGNYWYIENVKGGIPGAIMQTTEDMPPNYVSIYIQVDDVQACLDKAESLGGKTIVPPTPVPGGMGHIGVFIGPAGNNIGLHKG